MTVVHVHCVHLRVYNHVDLLIDLLRLVLSCIMRLNFHQTHFTRKTSAPQQP